MAIDPRTLESIRNPLAGLSKIGEGYARGVEMRQKRELMQMKREALEVEAEERDYQHTLDAAKEERAIAKRKEESEAQAATMKTKLLDYDEKQREDNFADSKAIANLVDKFQLEARQNPAIVTDENAYSQWLDNALQGVRDEDVLNTFRGSNPSQLPLLRQNAQFAINTYSGAKGEESFGEFTKIPGTELYGQQSSKTGKYSNVRETIDGTGKMGSSEFERARNAALNSKRITQEEADRMTEKRAGVLAGSEMRIGTEARLGETQAARYRKEEVALRKEYTEGSEHFRSMGETIDSAFAAMDSGDTKLSETLLNQVISQVQDTDVRAFQMYGEFDKEFGNLAERIQGKLSRFFVGTRTERERDEIRSVLSNFNEAYVKPAETKLRDRYRRIAIDQGKNPFIVVPPKNPEDIRDSSLLDNKAKIKMIKENFPDWKPQ